MNPDPQSSNDRDDVTLVINPKPLFEPDRVDPNVLLPLPKVTLKKF